MANRFEQGQVAVVTGAARGIGFGIAKRLAQEGVTVALLDRDRRGTGATPSHRWRARASRRSASPST